MKIKISSDAEDDLINGFWFYENNQSGLGKYFRSSVIADIDSLNIYAGIHAKHHRFHRKLCRSFPYTIYYKMDNPSLAIVVAVLDQRLDPDTIRKRLGKIEA